MFGTIALLPPRMSRLYRIDGNALSKLESDMIFSPIMQFTEAICIIHCAELVDQELAAPSLSQQKHLLFFATSEDNDQFQRMFTGKKGVPIFPPNVMSKAMLQFRETITGTMP
jgi:hypothetical protein